MGEGLYWHAESDGRVRCDLCPHACCIENGAAGRCGVRVAHAGTLQADGYGHVSAMQADPVEKKPLYHFHPGSMVFSIGGWGCNFTCDFCQNWSISQRTCLTSDLVMPDDVVQAALQSGSVGLAYTYNEPLVGIEYVLDCARAAHAVGLKNVLVTNGYVNSPAAKDLLAETDALNIDIKSMDDDFYRRYCRANLAPVLAFACMARRTGCHIEITSLIIPGLNDAEANVDRLAAWVARELGRQTPLHLTGYGPRHKMSVPPTEAAVLETLAARCEAHLDYVYLGNVPTDKGRDTLCGCCGAVLVARHGYAVDVSGMGDGACMGCGRVPPIVSA